MCLLNTLSTLPDQMTSLVHGVFPNHKTPVEGVGYAADDARGFPSAVPIRKFGAVCFRIVVGYHAHCIENDDCAHQLKPKCEV